MKEQEIVQQVLTDLNTALPDSVSARTGGGDNEAGPPVCILNWNAIRLRENGAGPLGDLVRDESGTVTGRELHRYYRMDLDVTVRTYNEGNRDLWLSDVADYFLAYEDNADLFHEDTTEWEVGDAEPRSNPAVEPDWYESGTMIRFKYVSRAVREAEALTSVHEGEVTDI